VFASRIANTSVKLVTPANAVVDGLAVVMATTPATACSSSVWFSASFKEM
jgi:hypothetical protein